MKPKLTREEVIQKDAEDLKRLGYAQQLFREMGGFSNFAISFSIISILTGAVILYRHGLQFGGPIINTIGWPLVSLMTLFVAASMAELASAYPTAGGLYFWSFRLGGKGWAWWTAWLNIVGLIATIGGINFAAAEYLIGTVARMTGLPADAPVPVFGQIDAWYFKVFVMALLTIPQIAINVFGIRVTARLNDFSVVWHILGVVVIVALLTLFGKHHNPGSFMLQGGATVTPLDASSMALKEGADPVPALAFGDLKLPSPLFNLFPPLLGLYQSFAVGLGFVVGLLQAQWTLTGYDASAHVAEETVMARLNSAWGVFLSVAVSAVVGWILLLVLTWCIPNGDVAAAVADKNPTVLYIVYGNLPAVLANSVAVLIAVAMWLCGLSCIASTGRAFYAFARDDGAPASALFKRVSPHYGTPGAAIIACGALAVVICLYAAAYSVVVSIGTICLYVAYMLPIYLNWRNKRSRQGEFTTPATAPWTLGKWGPLINGVAVVWIVIISVLFSIPPNELVLWTMVLLFALLGMYWIAYAGRRFTGPTAADEAELRHLDELAGGDAG